MGDYTPTTAEVRRLYAFKMAGDRIHRAAQYQAEFDRWLAVRDAETRRQTLEGARVEFVDGLPHDGTFEYTVSGDCDGSNVTHWRRLPRIVFEAGVWERTDRERYEAARALAEKGADA